MATDQIRPVPEAEPGATIAPPADEEAETQAVNAAPGRSLRLTLFAVGLVLLLLAVGAHLPQPFSLALYLASYLLIGGEIVLGALHNLVRGQIFDENFLMSLATVGALAIGDYPEAVSVMLFYQIGEFFQNLAINRSRRSIAALMDIRPDFANRLRNGELERVRPEEVQVGEIIVVRPGERIPLDGVVLSGQSALDTAALTGEALPRHAGPGSEVYSGSINLGELLQIEVKKSYAESTVARILDLVQNAASRKAPTEQFISKFARWYTPAVVLAAVALALLPPLFVPGIAFPDSLHRALIFLVVSCPCALVVSIPLSFFAGIGNASRQGILVKGSNYLEALQSIDTVVFDKTGTLTLGQFSLTECVPANGFSAEHLLELAAAVEQFSTHPLAVSIVRTYGQPIALAVAAQQETPGQGISAIVDGQTVLAGNAAYLASHGYPVPEDAAGGTIVHVAAAGQYAGYLAAADQIKPDSRQAIARLRDLGVRRIAMLTGDTPEIGRVVGKQLGLDQVLTGLLPHQKVSAFEALAAEQRSPGKIVFVGDGINDAPVLARADVGIAMGGIGSDAAIEAADVVLMTDEPAKLVTAIQIARRTRRIVWQNIVLALGVKGIVLILGALGLATMWAAVFSDVGVALLAILNAMRILRYNPVKQPAETGSATASGSAPIAA
jgi:Cd2+/Zn2+-exporting ATPase